MQLHCVRTSLFDLFAEVSINGNDGFAYGYNEKGQLLQIIPAFYVATETTEDDYQSVENENRARFLYHNDGRIDKIATLTNDYLFIYGDFGNVSQINIGGNIILNYEYYEKNGNIKKITYPNGFSEEYVYNPLDLLSSVWYYDSEGVGTLAYSYEYRTDGSISRITDNIGNRITIYEYDEMGKYLGCTVVNGTTLEPENVNTVSYTSKGEILYNAYNTFYQDIWGWKYEYYLSHTYHYNEDGTLRFLDLTSVINDTDVFTIDFEYTYDTLQRLTKRENLFNTDDSWFDQTETYTYRNFDGNETDMLIAQYINSIGSSTSSYQYEYDSRGNITSIYLVEKDKYITYEYDELNRLVRENNELLGFTYVMQYDANGNILSKRRYNYTTAENLGDVDYSETFTYGNTAWGDQLTSYNGTAITYDELGNPLSYYNGFTFTWQGRQLADASMIAFDRTFDISLTYNEAGLRQTKTVNGVTTTYNYNGSLLISEQNSERIILYIYDENASPIGFMCCETADTEEEPHNFDVYYYEKNLQGDVVSVRNSSGTVVVSYVYDAWGNVVSTRYGYGAYETTVRYNTIFYRGYHYDSDLYLYYLSSRYYDANIGRFISPDDISYLGANGDLNAYNLYAYCSNNPIVRVDKCGQFWDYVADVGFLIWSISDVVNDPSDWKNWAALGVDAIFAVVPFVPSGSGQIIKVGNKIDNAIDVVNSINKVDDIIDASKVTVIGRNMDRVTATASLIGKADNLYDAWKGYDSAASGVKKFFHNAFSMVHNGSWLFGKLRQGYTVIDIGITTLHKGYGLWYGTERIISMIWTFRNIWKIPINCS